MELTSQTPDLSVVKAVADIIKDKVKQYNDMFQSKNSEAQ